LLRPSSQHGARQWLAYISEREIPITQDKPGQQAECRIKSDFSPMTCVGLSRARVAWSFVQSAKVFVEIMLGELKFDLTLTGFFGGAHNQALGIVRLLISRH